MPGNKIFYGWYVVLACVSVSVLGIGARYSFGIFLKPLELEFNMSRGVSSSLFSVYMVLCCIFAAVGGWALDRFGPKKLGLWMAAMTGISFILTSLVSSAWQLFFSYSLFLSLGTGTIYTVANSTSSRWFNKKRGLAVGITSSGGGMGVVIIAPVAAYFITRFDWRWAFGIMGIILFAGMAAASFWLVKEPAIMGLSPYGEQKKTGRNSAENVGSGREIIHSGGDPFTFGQAVKERSFWLLWLTWLTISLALHMMMVHIVPYALSLGVHSMDAAFIISLMGLSNIPGRLVIGKLSDRVDRNALGAACILFQFSALIWLITAGELWMLYGVAVIFGFFWGGIGTITTVLVGYIFGLQNLGAIMGFMSAAWAAGAALGPGIAGVLFDITGHYLIAFSLAAGILLTAVFCVYFSRKPSQTEQACPTPGPVK